MSDPTENRLHKKSARGGNEPGSPRPSVEPRSRFHDWVHEAMVAEKPDGHAVETSKGKPVEAPILEAAAAVARIAADPAATKHSCPIGYTRTRRE
jgi:hypothetical protein